jgi:DNA-directed RNA polymerase subunit M/transcription elongation factor TFIIS
MLRRQYRARPNPVECAACGATDAIQIELRLPDETGVEFSSCHRCEHRWWTCDGAVIDLRTVLELVRQA